jgi:acetyl esterase/lipase
MSYQTGRFRGRDVTKGVEAKHCQDARFIWLEPVSPSTITGQLKQFAESYGVDSIRVPAYGFGEWQLGSNNDCLARDGEKIVLHLHGGGFVVSPLQESGVASTRLYMYRLEPHIPKMLQQMFHVGLSNGKMVLSLERFQ